MINFLVLKRKCFSPELPFPLLQPHEPLEVPGNLAVDSDIPLDKDEQGTGDGRQADNGEQHKVVQPDEGNARERAPALAVARQAELGHVLDDGDQDHRHGLEMEKRENALLACIRIIF